MKRRRRRINKTHFVLFIVIFVLLAGIGISVKNVLDLRSEQAELALENESLKRQKDALENELANVNEDDYIEDQARKQLRLLDPGELVFIFEDGDTPKEDAPEEEKKSEEAVPDALNMSDKIAEGVDQVALQGQSAANEAVEQYEEYEDDEE